MEDKRLEQVEKLLREERGVELSGEFRQNVMKAIEALPAPELISPRKTWRDWVYALKLMGSGEKVALGMIIVGLIALIIPGALDTLSIYQWELSDLTLSINIGETATSISLLSTLSGVIAVLFMTGVGAYAAKNHLISA